MRQFRQLRLYSTALRAQAETILNLDPAKYVNRPRQRPNTASPSTVKSETQPEPKAQKFTEPDPIFLQRKFFRALGKEPSAEDLDLAFKVYDKTFELAAGVDKTSCAQLCLISINANNFGRALESWTRFFETLTTRAGASKVAAILNNSEFDKPTLAALAAYFAAVKDKAQPEVALKLVPRTLLPADYSSLSNLGGITNPENLKNALVGLAKLQSNITNGFTSQKYLDTLKTLSKADLQKYWDQVLLSGSPVPEACYAAYIEQFAKFNMTETAFNLWREMVKTIKPSVVGWSALLQSVVRVSNTSPDLLLSLWDRMISHGIEPDARCYFALFNGLKYTKQIELLVKKFGELERHPEAAKLIDLNSINLMISVYCSNNQAKAALQLLKFAKKNEIKLNADTYSLLITSKALNTEQEAAVLAELAELNIEPDSNTYFMSIQQSLRENQPIGALYTEFMKTNPKQLDVYKLNNLLAAEFTRRAGRRRHENKVLINEFASTLKENNLKIGPRVLSAIVKYYLQASEIERAVECLDSFTSRTSQLRLSLYNQLIEFTLSRSWDKVALFVYKTMKDPAKIASGPNTETYLTIIKQLSRPGAVDDLFAQQLIREVVVDLTDNVNCIDNALAAGLLHPSVIGFMTQDIVHACGKFAPAL